jgi:hypothetical protein
MVMYYKNYAEAKVKNVFSECYQEKRNYPAWMTGEAPIEKAEKPVEA